MDYIFFRMDKMEEQLTYNRQEFLLVTSIIVYYCLVYLFIILILQSCILFYIKIFQISNEPFFLLQNIYVFHFDPFERPDTPLHHFGVEEMQCSDCGKDTQRTRQNYFALCFFVQSAIFQFHNFVPM